MLISLAYLYDRQGIFKGDLNVVQSNVLSWVLGDEANRNSEIKRQDYEVMALANNERGNVILIEQLQKNQKGEENLEWVTPQSEEDLEEMMKLLEP